MDLIERQDAIDAIKKCRNESDMPDKWYDGMSCALRCIYQLSSSQPKSYREGYQAGFKDAQPERKRGKWVEANTHTYGIYECTACKAWTYIPNEPRDYNFCPRCGADMRGEK